jgi:hypothetical protein
MGAAFAVTNGGPAHRRTTVAFVRGRDGTWEVYYCTSPLRELWDLLPRRYAVGEVRRVVREAQRRGWIVGRRRVGAVPAPQHWPATLDGRREELDAWTDGRFTVKVRRDDRTGDWQLVRVEPTFVEHEVVLEGTAEWDTAWGAWNRPDYQDIEEALEALREDEERT